VTGDFMSVQQDFTPAAIAIPDGRMNVDQNLAYVSCCGFDAHKRAGMDLRVFIFSQRSVEGSVFLRYDFGSLGNPFLAFRMKYCLHLQGPQCPKNPAMQGHIPEEQVSQVWTCSSGSLNGVT
jgi:hypothetical protein